MAVKGKVNFGFLSDLCGREVTHISPWRTVKFLSDLCGREDININKFIICLFLSDLCGREDIKFTFLYF